MLSSASSPQIIELKAGSPEDPDGSPTAAVFAAYVHAEHTRTFRQLLWRRLALLGIVWALAALTLAISRSVFLGGLAVLMTLGGGAAVVEWRAAEKLSELLEGPHRTNAEDPP